MLEENVFGKEVLAKISGQRLDERCIFCTTPLTADERAPPAEGSPGTCMIAGELASELCSGSAAADDSCVVAGQRGSPMSGLVTLFCLDCEELFCESCGPLHTSFGFATDHTMVRGADRQSLATELLDLVCKIARFCRLHETERETLYCRCCEEATCVVCFLEGHADCGRFIVAMDVAAEEIKKKLAGHVTMLEEQSFRGKKLLDELEYEEMRLLGESGDVERIIEAHGNAGRNVVSVHANALRKGLERLTEERRHLLRATGNTVDRQVAHLRTSKEVLERSVQKAASADLLFIGADTGIKVGGAGGVPVTDWSGRAVMREWTFKSLVFDQSTKMEELFENGDVLGRLDSFWSPRIEDFSDPGGNDDYMSPGPESLKLYGLEMMNQTCDSDEGVISVLDQGAKKRLDFGLIDAVPGMKGYGANAGFLSNLLLSETEFRTRNVAPNQAFASNLTTVPYLRQDAHGSSIRNHGYFLPGHKNRPVKAKVQFTQSGCNGISFEEASTGSENGQRHSDILVNRTGEVTSENDVEQSMSVKVSLLENDEVVVHFTLDEEVLSLTPAATWRRDVSTPAAIYLSQETGHNCSTDSRLEFDCLKDVDNFESTLNDLIEQIGHLDLR